MSDAATMQAPVEFAEFAGQYRVTYGRGNDFQEVLHWQVRGELFITVLGGDQARPYNTCTRCGGGGEYSFNPLDGTRCFGCWGSGCGTRLESWDHALRIAKRRIADRDRAARKQREAEAAREKAFTNWFIHNADLVKALEARDNWTGFVGNMADLILCRTALTDNQTTALRRALEQITARQEKQASAGHIGTIGERMELTVLVKRADYHDTAFGFSCLVIMETEAGNVLKAWSTGAFGRAAEDTVGGEDGYTPTKARIKATVKKHGDYQGVPQTELTRVTLVNWIEEEATACRSTA